jgi:formylglycine-generating enzyme required for sulfatase activity
VGKKAWLILLFSAFACSTGDAPRKQWLVWIDTDAPVVGMLDAHPELSPDAAVDTVLFEALDHNGAAFDSRLVIAPDPRDWPVSFGILPPPAGEDHVRIRARAWNSAFVRATDPATLATSANVIIDRLIDLSAIGDGVDARLVTLSGDCMGARPAFATPADPVDRTCVAGMSGAAASDGVTSVSGTSAPPSVAGTWAHAKEQPCTGTPPAGAVCIPGGMTVLGSLDTAGLVESITGVDDVPLRSAALSPFFLDRDEFTVGRYRAFVRAGFPDDVTTSVADTGGKSNCTWAGASDATRDALPLNCVTRETAKALCAASAGALPGEAQWEHAARGRGRRFRYPWGDASPVCCGTTYGRSGSLTTNPGNCPGSGVAAASERAGCDGPLDVSIDGVRDLGANVQEWTRDATVLYSDPCWGTAIALDPSCVNPALANITRGGSFESVDGSMLSALRGSESAPTYSTGFRCAYPDGAR